METTHSVVASALCRVLAEIQNRKPTSRNTPTLDKLHRELCHLEDTVIRELIAIKNEEQLAAALDIDPLLLSAAVIQ